MKFIYFSFFSLLFSTAILAQKQHRDLNVYFDTAIYELNKKEHGKVEKFITNLGIDVIPSASDLVHAPLDGTVVFSSWTAKDGNVVCVQHENNLLTLYKHNASLRKKVGNFVQAGDVIAIVGNSGEQTTSKHLHMEMWYNGLPLNPENYINF